MTMAALLKGKRLVICAGPGGVGKTTSSAAIALGIAATGATVAVITIDPAQRLASALGLRELANEPSRVPQELLMSAGATVGGELWAMTLDVKRTFDDLIDQVAPDGRRAAEIKANRLYRELSSAISGSQEFTAVAKLFELDRAGRFDVLVLDTPPSRNTLDFLHAPRRLGAFLDSRALRALEGPAGFGLRAFGRGTLPLMGVMGRLSGVEVIADATAFFQLLRGMTDGFSTRAARVQAMLRAPPTGFLLITSAERQPIDETIWFGRTLLDDGLPFTGIVVNRVHERLEATSSQAKLQARAPRRLSRDLASRVTASAKAHQLLARRDERAVSRLRHAFPGGSMLTVPDLPRDVHDMAGLWDVYEHMSTLRG